MQILCGHDVMSTNILSVRTYISGNKVKRGHFPFIFLLDMLFGRVSRGTEIIYVAILNRLNNYFAQIDYLNSLAYKYWSQYTKQPTLIVQFMVPPTPIPTPATK